jgi:micrococcal nuclease
MNRNAPLRRAWPILGLLAGLWLLPETGQARPPDKPVATADLVGTVVKVVDGETVQVQLKDQHRPIIIRLIGLETPAKASREKDGQEPWGTRAQQFLSLLLTRNEIRVEFDVLVPVSNDNTQRWGYIWLDKKLVNEEMLRSGHAVLATRPPNVKHVDRLTPAQKEAREKERGIWDPKEPLPEPPSAYLARNKEKAADQKGREEGVALAGWEKGCVIGNKSTKKYHLPSGRYYEQMKTSQHALFFRTEDDAKKAGYSAASK